MEIYKDKEYKEDSNYSYYEGIFNLNIHDNTFTLKRYIILYFKTSFFKGQRFNFRGPFCERFPVFLYTEKEMLR